MFSYRFDGFLRRVFCLLRAGGILYIYNALAWRHRYLLSKILSAFFTRSLGPRFAPSVTGAISLQKLISSSLFPLTKKGCYFRFRILANHLAFFFLSLVRVQISVGFHSVGDPFGLLYLSPEWGYGVQIAWPICFLPSPVGRNWPTFFISLLTVNLWRPANSNTEGSRNSLFLSSQ